MMAIKVISRFALFLILLFISCDALAWRGEPALPHQLGFTYGSGGNAHLNPVLMNPRPPSNFDDHKVWPPLPVSPLRLPPSKTFQSVPVVDFSLVPQRDINPLPTFDPNDPAARWIQWETWDMAPLD